MNRPAPGMGYVGVAVVLLATTSQSLATWSICLTDSATKEVAVGTVTCLDNLDLLELVPVVVVGKGTGACQSAGDLFGTRRPIIFNGLINGTAPADILVSLAGVVGHQQRQYGIADTQGRTITFSGSQNAQWAGGVTGLDGSLAYAIQGNILAGSCVVPAIEQAVLTTAGDMPAKLMAGMEAARANGGDGRCSCSQANPTSCGCPPASFTKSGHIGGMVVSRIGDADDSVCNADGCADGDYFMRLNVSFQPVGATDPVLQLQALFDAWRAALVGRPDAIQSEVEFSPPTAPPDGASSLTMQISLRDWSGSAIGVAISDLTVLHSPDSAGISSIGVVTDEGGGDFSVVLTAGTSAGIDRFVVTVDDGIRPVVLMPEPSLRYFDFGDMDCSGAVDVGDVGPFAQALVDPDAYAGAFPLCHVGLAAVGGGGPDGGAIQNFVDLLLN